MSSAAATSFTCTPGKLLNFTAVALNRSPYFSILRGLAFATTHLQPVRPRCQLNRGKLGVAVDRNGMDSRHCSTASRCARLEIGHVQYTSKGESIMKVLGSIMDTSGSAPGSIDPPNIGKAAV